MVAEIALTALGLSLVCLLPGYALTYAVFGRTGLDRYERAVLSAVSGISVSVVSVFSLSYFAGLRVDAPLVFSVCAGATVLFAAVHLAKRKTEPPHEGRRIGKLELSAVAFLLALTFFSFWSVHYAYPYPLIADEWQHIAEGRQIEDTGRILLHNPYYRDAGPQDDAETGFFEMGFHVLLAEISLISGQRLVDIAWLLPAFFSCIASVAALNLTHKTVGNFNAGLLSMFFYAGLNSSANLLGPHFLVPLTVGFVYVYAIAYAGAKGIECDDRRLILFASFLTLSAALVHPWSAAYAAAVFFVYLLMRPAAAKKNIVAVAAYFALPLLSFVYIFKVLWQGSLDATLSYFAGNVFIRTLEIPVDKVAEPFFPVAFYGVVPFVLAAAGLLYVVGRAGPEARIHLAWVVVASAIFAAYQATGHTFLVPYERVLYYLFLGLVPLSAIGLFWLLRGIGSGADKQGVYAAAALVVLLLTAYGTYTDMGGGREGIRLIVDDESYEALVWMSGEGAGKVVLARPEISSAIYPIAGDHVVAISSAQLGKSLRGADDARDYFMSGCDKKLEVLRKYDVDYVFVGREDESDCRFLETVYSGDDIIVYSFEDESA